jgi:hypothetical protein
MSTSILRRRSRAVRLSIAAAIAGVLPAGAALADDSASPVFGRPGQIVLPQIVGVRTGIPLYLGMGITGASGAASIGNAGWGGVFGYTKSNIEYPVPPGAPGEGSARATSELFWVSPAGDVLVSRRVSIGLAAGVLWGRFSQEPGAGVGAAGAAPYWSDALSVAVAPRVGYVVPLGRGLSFWPRLNVGASYSEQRSASGQPSSQTWAVARSIAAGLDLALVYHPHERLMFQIAPQLGAGRTVSDGLAPSESTWMRVGGEATAGLVF